MANDAGTAYIEVDPDLRGFGGKLNRQVRPHVDGLGSHISSSLGGAFTSAAGAAGKIFAGVAVAGAGAFGAIGAYGLKAAGDFQQTRIAFEGILGSAEKAQAMLTDLRKFAASTPFEFPELATASKSLLAVGFNAKDVIPIMTKLGNTAAALGVGGEAINGVVRALGQMKGKGKASAEELNQISEQIPGFSAVSAIAKYMGITVKDAFNRMEEGAVSADVAIEAILKGMEEFPGAAGAMERQSKTLNGVISSMKDAFRDALIDGIEPFLPALASGIAKATPFLKTAVAGIIETFRSIVTTVVPIVADLVARFREAWPQIRETVTAAIGTAVTYIQANWPKIKDVFESALGAVRAAFDLAVPVFNVFVAVVKDVINNLPILSGAFDAAAAVFRTVGGFIGEHTEGFKQLAEVVGVLMVARLAALQAQALLTFGASTIAAITGYTTATTAAATATAGAGAAGTGGLAMAAFHATAQVGLLAAGFVVLARTVNDRVPVLEAVDKAFINWERRIPIVGGYLADLDRKVLGLGDSADDASGRVQTLHERLLDYARGYEATVTIDASQAYRTLDQLRSDLATVNANIGRSGPGGGNRAAADQIESEIGSRESTGNGDTTPSGIEQYAIGMEKGQIPGPPSRKVPIIAHGREWVVTPEQMAALRGSARGSAAPAGIGPGIDYERLAQTLAAVLAANPLRSYVVATDVSKGQRQAGRR